MTKSGSYCVNIKPWSKIVEQDGSPKTRQTLITDTSDDTQKNWPHEKNGDAESEVEEAQTLEKSNHLEY